MVRWGRHGLDLLSDVHEQLRVRDDADWGRYVGEIEGTVVASAFYKVRATTWILIHTEVDEGHSGQGIGSAVARFALDDVRAKGGRVVPICPFVAAFIKRHPEYQDLIDHETWDGIRSRQEAPRSATPDD
jgi:predicted GNAT family acetyltransferase